MAYRKGTSAAVDEKNWFENGNGDGLIAFYTRDGATQDQVKYGCEYGQHLGMAFQMVDDLLDVIGTEEALGKSIGKDVAEEKLTWIAIRGIEGTREDAARETALAVDAAAKIGGDMKFLQTLAQSTLNRVQ